MDSKVGRPRSEQARAAVLHAVDDLLVEVGYAAMTMKGIAERAGVGRQTVYRWWATKAEVLFEACVWDAPAELAIVPSGDARRDLAAYLEALIAFLDRSPAGAAWRALVGEAQHDRTVADLIASNDVLARSARLVLDGIGVAGDDAVARLVGPVFFWLITGGAVVSLDPDALAGAYLRSSR